MNFSWSKEMTRRLWVQFSHGATRRSTWRCIVESWWVVVAPKDLSGLQGNCNLFFVSWLPLLACRVKSSSLCRPIKLYACKGESAQSAYYPGNRAHKLLIMVKFYFIALVSIFYSLRIDQQKPHGSTGILADAIHLFQDPQENG